MLDQHADESLHAAEGRAVDHHGSMWMIVGPGVSQIKPLRKLVIHLHRSKLPLAPNDVPYDKVDLRPIKRRLARLIGERHAQRRGRILARLLRPIPLLWLSDVFGRIGIAQADA